MSAGARELKNRLGRQAQVERAEHGPQLGADRVVAVGPGQVDERDGFAPAPSAVREQPEFSVSPTAGPHAGCWRGAMSWCA
jgi:hypothetical protein